MTNKLAIIGGSGLYDVEEFKDREFLDIKTSWGNPSDKILKTNIMVKRFISYQDMEEGIIFHRLKLILEQILML